VDISELDLTDIAQVYVAHKNYRLSLEEACKKVLPLWATAISKQSCNTSCSTSCNSKDCSCYITGIEASLKAYRNTNKLLEDCLKMINVVDPNTKKSRPVFEEPII
jgi:hypothetical protein